MMDWDLLQEALLSPSSDPNEADLNVVDGLFAIADALNRLAVVLEKPKGLDRVIDLIELRRNGAA